MFVTCCIKGVKKIQLCTPSFRFQRVEKRISFLGKVKKGYLNGAVSVDSIDADDADDSFDLQFLGGQCPQRL